MKKMLLPAALAVLITGCAQQTFTVGNKPTAVTPKEIITHHFSVSEIGQKKTIDATKACGDAEGVVETKTQQIFVSGLPGFITLSVYTPPKARVCCSQQLRKLPIDMGSSICIAYQYASGFLPVVFAR